jgi:hypothetical protein
LYPSILTLGNIFPDFLSFLGNQTGNKEYKKESQRERELQREGDEGQGFIPCRFDI